MAQAEAAVSWGLPFTEGQRDGAVADRAVLCNLPPTQGSDTMRILSSAIGVLSCGLTLAVATAAASAQGWPQHTVR